MPFMKIMVELKSPDFDHACREAAKKAIDSVGNQTDHCSPEYLIEEITFEGFFFTVEKDRRDPTYTYTFSCKWED